MLPLGYLGPRNEWHTSGQTTFTRNEQVTIMSLWSILPSPLMYGGNPARLSSDAWTLALLTNEEVMAVNQDVLGARGKRMAAGANEIWVRDLSGGRKAVAFFNRGTQDATMSATFSTIGVTGTPVVRDLWRRADVTGMTTGLSASVPGGAALMYTLSPAGTGTGGTGGSGGAPAAARERAARVAAAARPVAAAPAARRAPRAAAGGAAAAVARARPAAVARAAAAERVAPQVSRAVLEPAALRASADRRRQRRIDGQRRRGRQRRCWRHVRHRRRRRCRRGRSRRRDSGRRRDDWRRFGSWHRLQLRRRAWAGSAAIRPAGAGRTGCAPDPAARPRSTIDA